jgi:DNA-binding beta-propeller fold protein YncE
VVPPSDISRRALLVSSAGLLACGRRKATGFRGFCFVANQESRSVTVVDLSRFRVRQQIALGAAPSAVLAHPTESKVYVLTPQEGTVFEIDAVSHAITRRARAGNTAAAMQLAPSGDALWVLYREPAALVELPFTTFEPARRIRLASTPDSFDLSRENRAAIASQQNRSIVVASLANASIERTINAGAEPSLLRFQADGRQILAGSRPERSLGIFQTDSGKIVVRLPLPLEPRHFCFNADGGQLFVSGNGMDAVVIVYPYRTEVAETMLAGHAPDGMAVTDSPPFLLVTNPQSNSITVLDFDNMGKKLVAAVQVGQEPRHILITPDKQYALVLNRKSGDMAVIRIYSLTNQDSMRRYRYPTPLFTMIPVGEHPVDAAIVSFG